MASNDVSRDPRLQNKKRVASQPPASAMQPSQKNPKPADITKAGAAQAPTFGASRPQSTSTLPQNAPMAHTSAGQPASELSVVRKIPAQPTAFDLLQASAEISGKLAYAQVEKAKWQPLLDKALKQYHIAAQYFADFAPTRDMHTNQVRRARQKVDDAAALVAFFEQESTQVKQLISASSPDFGGLFGPPANDSVPQQLTALRESYNALKDDVAAQAGEARKESEEAERMDRAFEAQQKKLEDLTKQLDLLRDKQDRATDQAADAFAGMEKLEIIQRGLREVTDKVTKLEAEAKVEGNKNDGLGMVQFTPVVAPEEPDPELSQVQQIWNTIAHLEMATASHKRQLDNLTTDDVVNQMVNVMGQHWPDAKNCQAAVDSLKSSINDLAQRIVNVEARVDQGQNGGAPAEVAKLRGQIDALKQRVDGHDALITQGKQNFDNFNNQVKAIANQVSKLEGNQEEALRKAFG
ncbi:hypothetical protein PRZ48_003245 [Zasmidium cellare]|uniref:Uncharacterized protein n=1 Tax=Zasmidium cellare TaxID=395010 RepID=A0ABR0EUV3_ZASCE|nr:hypothetical protein PRZ48_003245 [Zasmidium cellare]